MKSKIKKILVLTDNERLYNIFREIVKKQKIGNSHFIFRFSENNNTFKKKFSHNRLFKPIDITKKITLIQKKYDFIISLHSKTVFPAQLVRSTTCINIHPGYNPYNRGWFPQVFSILNHKPLGATIHVMDEKIDHGPIIDQIQVPLYSWDTSLTAYERVMAAEMDLVRKNLKKIVNETYHTRRPKSGGNLNTKKDFNNLCKLNLSQRGTFESFIQRLRALSHGGYNNAYFIDKHTGRKIFVSIMLTSNDE